jgi:hypothetical protein
MVRKPFTVAYPAAAAREAAKQRKVKRKAKGLRMPAPIELRPAAVQHSYGYQLHRREPA